MKKEETIIQVILDSGATEGHRAELVHERQVAVADLLRENRFVLKGDEAFIGPYHLHLRIADNRLVLDVQAAEGDAQTALLIPVTPFRGIIKDYRIICDSYYEAVKTAPTVRIEALDMGRRAAHNEAAEMLEEFLESSVELDFATARRLFTLLYVLHIRA
ncbi:MAG: UPF0262 family protein [Rickettsiales bacterium]|nr:UPF0262 family protein [Rickettsiales bacterium]